MKSWNTILLLCSVLVFTQCAWSGKQFASEKSDWEKRAEEEQSGPAVYRLKDLVDTAADGPASKPLRPPMRILMKSKANEPGAKKAGPKIEESARSKTVLPQEQSEVQSERPSKGSSETQSQPDTALSVQTWLTPELWEQCFPKRFGVAEKGTNSKEQGCVDFFTYASFMEAAQRFPRFLNEGSLEMRRRELAAFFAHISMETGGLRYKEQLNKTKSYSVPHAQYPPVSPRDYHGRGPIQLSYNYNYGLFSEHCYGDKMILLDDPDLILRDSVVSFTSAIWFWMTPQGYKPACHDVMVGRWDPLPADIDANRLPGFGLTLNIINAPQCGVEPLEPTQRRYRLYADFCNLFGVDMGPNAECQEQVPYGKK